MYHYENIPIFIYGNSPSYNRINESFVGGISIDYNEPKLKVKNQLNFQYSHNERYNNGDLIYYDNHIYWANSNLEYKLNNTFSLYSNIYYKDSSTDLIENEWINKKLNDMELPKSIRIGAILRDKKIIIPNSETIFEENDDVVFFSETDSVKKLEKLLSIRH